MKVVNESRPPETYRSDSFGLLTSAASVFMLIFLALPLLALLSRLITTGGLALSQLDLGALIDSIGISLLTTTISGVIIFVFGTPLALVLARRDFLFKPIINVLVELPIVMPPVVAGLALLLAFGRRGLLGAPLNLLGVSIAFTPLAVILAQVFVASPFYIRAAQIQFQTIPHELEEAAEIDGATGYRALREVLLPLSWRGLLAGFILSWARALGEFGATILFAGNLQGSTQTMPLLVYASLEQHLDAAITAGLILIALAAGSMAAVQWLAARNSGAEGDSEQRGSPH